MSFLPEGLTAEAAAIVVIAAFFTSAVTAAFGIGGGLLLLAVMGTTLPPAAVVPVHGVAQLGSNLSRFTLLRRDVVWPALGWFAAGCLLGSFIGASVYIGLPPWLLRLGVGIFVIATVWAPKPSNFNPGPRTFASVGAVGSFLSMFFGATGPIAAAAYGATGWGRMNIVATHAAAMTTQHGVKSLAFGIVGFDFFAWATLIAAIVSAGALGSIVGARILIGMPEALFQRGFRWALTITATYLIIRGAMDGLIVRTG
ncbi:MAG: sulfite exporter TauE/SafE family protein [Pseudomonadota bacterium]